MPLLTLAPGIADLLPDSSDAYFSFARLVQTKDGDNPTEEVPWNLVYMALQRDLSAGADLANYEGNGSDILRTAAAAAPAMVGPTAREAIADLHDGWTEQHTWATIQTFSDPYTAGYFLASFDLRLTPDGVERVPDDQRIYMLLFQRTIFMSLTIMAMCVLLGYPSPSCCRTSRRGRRTCC